MSTFALIRNPVIAFVDNELDFRYMTEVRSRLPPDRTLIFKVPQSEMWSFRLVPRIAAVVNQSKYPTHLPNPVDPRYSAAMHAKYEVMLRALSDNPFQTRYFCWLDVGLFRDLSDGIDIREPNSTRGKTFSLELPPGFRKDSIAFNEVFRRDPNYSLRELVYAGYVWVCGCFFVGEVEVTGRWIAEYMYGVEQMLKLGQMSTDQQVIYFIFNFLNPRTKIQTYRGDGRYNDWFHLAYVSREEGMRRALAYNCSESVYPCRAPKVRS